VNERSRTSVRPTVFGVVVVALLLVAVALRPPSADPSVTGLVWAGLFGAAVLGVVWPLVTVRIIGVRVLAAPTDLVVGQLGTLQLELTGRASGLAISATGSGTSVIDVVSPGPISIPFSVGHRGAYSQIRIDISSDAPFGVLQARGTRVVEVPHLLLVGPLAQPCEVHPGELPAELMEPVPTGSGATGDVVRSVRPYVVGDPAHLVHWPTTARTGTLVVRELEPPAARGIAIVVDLGAPGVPPASDAVLHDAAVERCAAQAAGAARAARERGARVVLCTAEATGPVVADAPDELSTQRRLALAGPGRPPSPPAGWPVLFLSATHDPQAGPS
jgi:uncharacterized protein (DUF58 family)